MSIDSNVRQFLLHSAEYLFDLSWAEGAPGKQMRESEWSLFSSPTDIKESISWNCTPMLSTRG